MEEGKAVRVFAGLQRRFVHQSTNGEVRHQQAEELLANQFRRLAAQDNLGAAQMRFQFVQRRLSGKGLARC